MKKDVCDFFPRGRDRLHIRRTEASTPPSPEQPEKGRATRFFSMQVRAHEPVPPGQLRVKWAKRRPVTAALLGVKRPGKRSRRSRRTWNEHSRA
jgi:hypothetical protein